MPYEKKTASGDVKPLLDKLAQGAKDVFNSEKYAAYLQMLDKFHTYSYRNVLLILMQCPGATKVAGYNSWKNNFNRHVKRYENGIKILGYAPKKRQVQRPKLGKYGTPLLNSKGQPIMEEVTITVPAYKPVTVFDVSQTEGEPLPEYVTPLQGNNVADFKLLLSSLADLSPYPISFENVAGANGYCDHSTQKIAVQQGMSQEMTLKTAIHEIAHAREHGNEQGQALNRRTKEVEAESIAFIVCTHLGIDTSDYSFGYVAGWSSDRNLKELGDSMNRIQKGASQMIEKLDAAIERTRARETTASQISKPVQDTFSIYQLRQEPQTQRLLFAFYDSVKGNVKKSNYDLVYTSSLKPGTNVSDTLDSIYERFNLYPPKDFKGHSLSVSDVIVLHQNGRDTAHYVDLSGFRNVPEFTQEPATTPRRYNADGERLWNGKTSKQFSDADVQRFMAETQERIERGSKISTICTSAMARAAEINAGRGTPSRQPEHNREIE